MDKDHSNKIRERLRSVSRTLIYNFKEEEKFRIVHVLHIETLKMNFFNIRFVDHFLF